MAKYFWVVQKYPAPLILVCRFFKSTPWEKQTFDRGDKTLPRYNVCLFHIQLRSVKAQKYWLATNVLHFNVHFVADFFYNVRPVLYPGFYILILGSKNEELINRI